MGDELTLPIASIGSGCRGVLRSCYSFRNPVRVVYAVVGWVGLNDETTSVEIRGCWLS